MLANKSQSDNHHYNMIHAILGDVLLKSGLPQIFGISKNDNGVLLNDPEGLKMLAGFLKEAAEGNHLDPKDILSWKQKGEDVFLEQTL